MTISKDASNATAPIGRTGRRSRSRTTSRPRSRKAGNAFVIVDCLTLWVWNLSCRGDDHGTIVRAAADFASAASQRNAPTVVVSNEVGLGVHPETEEGRVYRDLLGAVNRAVADEASPALLMVAGRAMLLHDPKEFLR